MEPSVTPVVPFSTVRSWDTNHATWTFLNPSRGVYTWRSLDNWTSAEAGKDLIYTFGLTPGWAASNPGAGTPYGYGSSCSLPANMDDWDAFVTAIATHVAGKVKYWELWNEPMNYIYWCGDMPTMVTMAQHARSIIKSIDPSAMILAPSTDKDFGEVWIKSFLSLGGAATIDVMTIHGYPSPYRPESIVPMVAQYRTLMAANGIGSLPIWDTEQHGGPQGGIDIAKMYLLEWSSGVSKSMLYAYDGGGYLWGSNTGLTADGIAYGEVYKWMVGASLNSPCSQDTAGTYTCNLERSDYQAEAIWNSTASATVAVLPQFVQYRDLQGGVHPITNGSVTVGNAPILIETAATNSTQLSFASIAQHTYGDSPFPIYASSASNGNVTYSVVSGPATISGSVVTLTGAGTVVLGASQAASGNFLASSASATTVVSPKPVPAIALAPVADQMVYGGPVSVQATSASPAAITYSIVSGPATISGKRVTFTATGAVVIAANQPETATLAATATTTTFNVLPKPAPTLAFTTVPTKTYGTQGFNVSAASNSHGQITYSIVSGPATISNAWVTVSGPGPVVVKATQAEASTYAAAATTTSFTVLPKPVPTLTLPTVATITNGASGFNVRAASNSSGAITYSIVSGPASITNAWVVVSGVGTVTVKASQSEISTYAAATATTSFNVVAKPVPTLTLPTAAAITNGAPGFNLRAASNSSGAITYSIVSGPASITNAWVVVSGVGKVTVKATQAEISTYAAASTTASFNVVAKPVPTLTIPTIATKMNGAGAFSVRAASNSSGAITYAIVSGPATISGSVVTVTGVGTVVLKAVQAEISTYAATTATTGFSVSAKPVPTLTLPTIATKTNGVGPFSARASSNSSGAITYAIVSGPATISGSSVTVTGVGTVVVKATQAEITTYAAANTTTSFSVSAKPVPALTLPTIPTKTNGVGAFSARATSNSGGIITYAIASGPATISGSAVTVTGVGTVVVKASQAEITTYAATTATTSFAVVAKPVPALALNPLATQTYSASPLYIKATSNSTGPITYAVVSGPATISKATLTATGLGTITVSATQAETKTYAAATTTSSFNVVAKPLTFGAIGLQTYGNAPFSVSATSQSAGAVTYSVLSGPATIAGSVVSPTGAGTVVIGASQAAAGMYPATTATTTVNLAPRLPTLAFASIAAQSVDKPPFTVTATSPSSGAVTYSVLSGPATISGSTVTMTGVGTVLLGASQAATDNYTAASATSTFAIAASNGSTPAAVAARLLDQSSFGPTLSTVAHVQSVGVAGYLQEQFTAPATKFRSFSVAAPLPECTSSSMYNCVQTEWWNGLLNGPDQLRQRVAFAFSEMFVVSTEGVDTMAVPQFQGVLIDDAFGNYEKMLKDVALTPAMGGYLNMLNSAAQSGGKIANENFARENMQLFTTGLNLLNSDGSLQLDGNGNPIPVYTEDQVRAASKAYTGWTFATATAGIPTVFPNRTPNFTVPMVPVESAHDTSSKTLLNNTVLPGGQTAEQDLDGVIANLFNHPNTGPFVSRQLIQHLVTSTPSPSYIARVAAIFANNGAGVRGDLQAVVRAILTDEEARAGDTSENLNDGHQREPILFITGLARGLQITNTDPNGSNKALSMAANSLNQQPFSAPSVFNFFPADYMLPGTTTNAPEFGLENTAQVAIRLSLADQFVRNGLHLFNVDLSNTSTLGTLATNPATLVDTLSTLFMHAQMSDEMRSTIVNTITPITSPAQRARMAAYLVVTSPQYNVIH